MSTLTQASKQWSTRPAEERFTSLDAMAAHFQAQRAISRAAVVSSRHLRAVPDGADGLLIEGPSGYGFAPSNWAFGQAAQLVGDGVTGDFRVPGIFGRELDQVTGDRKSTRLNSSHT